MASKIKTKFFIVFGGMIIIIMGSIALSYYTLNTMHRDGQAIRTIAEETDLMTALQIDISNVVMPPNDFLITGDKREEAKFIRLTAELEDRLKSLNRVNHGAIHNPESIVLTGKMSEKYALMKEKAEDIFRIKNPVGSHRGSILMKEMDAISQSLILADLKKQYDIEKSRHETIMQRVENTRRRLFTIIAMSSLALLITGSILAIYFLLSFERPISMLHDGIKRIIAGNLDFHFSIDTGDEIEEMAKGFNVMAEKLEKFETELERFRKVTLQRELRMKELKRGTRNNKDVKSQ